MNRRSLILKAADAAADARAGLDVDEFASIDVYAAAATLGADVRFVDVSMEGFYRKGPPARIFISSLRPLARRAFTCAHEVGHHWFGHSTTLDELQSDDRHPSQKPEEILAEAFGSFLLMPTVGVRSAFSRRGWKAAQASPLQMLTIACEFGVGYTTLITHLALTTHDISESHRAALSKWTPQRIRKQTVNQDEDAPCLFLDEHSSAPSYDVEAGDAIAAPRGVIIDGEVLTHTGDIGGFSMLRALKQGRASTQIGTIQCEIRISRRNFVGRALFRHMEDPDDA